MIEVKNKKSPIQEYVELAKQIEKELTEGIAGLKKLNEDIDESTGLWVAKRKYINIMYTQLGA